MATLLSYALTTVADVKELLGIDAGDSTKNNLIIRKINQSTLMIESFCSKPNGQHFASTVYTDEEYDGTGTNQLSLRNRPVITFTSFSERNTTENDSSWSVIDTELYFVDNNAGVIDCNFTLNQNWNLYKVTYTAGYTDIPADLAEACATLAAYLVDNATTGTSIKSKEQGPKKIEYFDNSSGQSLIESLGIDDMLVRYIEYPILEDK